MGMSKAEVSHSSRKLLGFLAHCLRDWGSFIHPLNTPYVEAASEAPGILQRVRQETTLWPRISLGSSSLGKSPSLPPWGLRALN